MKILNFIKKVINGKPKVDRNSTELVFPELKNGEFVLSMADRNTGIILNDKFEYATLDKTTVYKKFSDLNAAVKIAREIKKTNATIELWIHNHKEQSVYFIDLEKEVFHKLDLEFKFKLKQQITDLPNNRLVDFALVICKRLLPAYIHFHNIHQWGDPNALQDAINYCESHTISKLKENRLQDYHNQIDAVTPDTADFGDYDGSYALNAACSVMALLIFLINGDKESIVEISTYMTNTIDFKLSEANPDLTDKEIEEHPDMIKEWKYQLDLLQLP